MRHLHPLTSRILLLGACALVPGVVACGAKATDGSTETGNPPLIDEQAISIQESADGVVVSGTPGAVAPGAKVTVTNLTTDAEASVTADADGSFEVEIKGDVDDGIQVEVTSGGETRRVTLKSDPFEPLELRERYVLEEAEGYTPVEGFTVTISFREELFSFDAGCNGHSGVYSLCEGSRLCTKNTLSTLIGCEDPLGPQEDWFSDFFQGKPFMAQSGDRLTFTGEDATLTFLDEEVADPDRDLLQRKWTVDTYLQAESASGNSAQAAPPTLFFQADGSVEVFTGCNGAGARFDLSGAKITFSEMAADQKACLDESGAAEAHVLKVLADGTATFEIDRNRLTLMRGALGVSATTD